MFWKPFTSSVETLTSLFVNRVLIRHGKDEIQQAPVDAFMASFPFENPGAFFGAVEPQPLPPGWFREEGRQDGAIVGEFRFPSDAPVGDATNDMVKGVAVLHPMRERSKHIILLHGWITPTHHQSIRVAYELLKYGYSTYIMELPYHMHRRPSKYFSGTFLINSDMRVLFYGIRQAVTDTRKLIHGLRDEGVTSVGLAGFSLGAHTAGIVSSLEEDLDGLALVAPLVDPCHTFLYSPMLASGRELFNKTPAPFDLLQRYLSTLELYQFQPLVRRDRILLINAVYDRVVFPDKVRKLWQAWKYPSLLEFSHGHVTIFFGWEPFEAMASFLAGASESTYKQPSPAFG